MFAEKRPWEDREKMVIYTVEREVSLDTNPDSTFILDF